MITYAVHMVNFGNMKKGSFKTLSEAIAHAKDLGFECAIWLLKDDENPMYIQSVKPY